jgi:hypothetical protein
MTQPKLQGGMFKEKKKAQNYRIFFLTRLPYLLSQDIPYIVDQNYEQSLDHDR